MQFSTIDKNDIHLIKPLWEKLNQIHLNDSTHFKEHYKQFSFDERCNHFSEIHPEDLHIKIVSDNDRVVGYCISSYTKGTGEIDSLFVDESHRNLGLGKALFKNALSWFELKCCKKVTVSVAEGHESVLPFYRQFDFFPRSITLQHKKSK
ncbi:MAG: GNAT family N-acetyltransferase [Fibrobacter sp.]|nr:GNAT family N-acetyltransferase [Fibrobacter sp.]